MVRLRLGLLRLCFHSISFPSEWGHEKVVTGKVEFTEFPLISFPSEWGRGKRLPLYLHSMLQVSIQLVSPASGDFGYFARKLSLLFGNFHSISFPSEWGHLKGLLIEALAGTGKFPFN